MKRLVIIAVALFAFMIPTTPANAAEPVCSASVTGQAVAVRCVLGNVVLLNVNLPINIPTITLPPLPAPPRATVTVRVNVPGDTETVRVPGPTKTVTKAPKTVTVTLPGEDKTIRVPVTGPTKTATVTASANPSPVGPTPSASNTPGGQSEVHRANMGGTRTETIVKGVGVGALALAALALLGFLALLLGYKLGFTDGGQKELTSEREWMRNLLDKK